MSGAIRLGTDKNDLSGQSKPVNRHDQRSRGPPGPPPRPTLILGGFLGGRGRGGFTGRLFVPAGLGKKVSQRGTINFDISLSNLD
jgi:hypothetical protein